MYTNNPDPIGPNERLLAAALSIDSSPEWRELAVLLIQHLEDADERWGETDAHSTTCLCQQSLP